MRPHIIKTGVLAALLLLGAGAAEAQSRTRTLADGRTLTVPVSMADCDAPTVSEDTAETLALDYACRAPSRDGGPADTPGEGALLVLAQPAGQTPDQFLAGQARSWWPDWDEASRASHISRSRKATARGDAAVVCLHRDNIDALNGDAVCVLDQPGLQVVIAGRSTMALTADNVVDTLLKGMTLR